MTDGADEYEAVVFDMDGVLLEGAATPAEVYADAADDALESFGVEVPESERARFRQHSYDERLIEKCEAFGIEPEAFWERKEGFASKRANERLANGARVPYPDTAVLSELPVTLGVVSNNRHETASFVARELLDAEFAVVIGRDPTPEGFAKRKPNPHYLTRALTDLDVENALYVGDREKDMIAAQKAGIDGALIRREHNQKITCDDPPAHDITTLEQLRELV